jgi:hypothetical protein
MSSLHRLVYYSRNHVSDTPETFSSEVADILEKSRVNNARDGITGALLFNAGCFAQVLEGPLGAIEATFERIQQDERHGEVSLLSLESQDERSFPNWAMGFIGMSAEHAERFAEIGTASQFDPSRLSGSELHMLLRDLALEEEGAAG